MTTYDTIRIYLRTEAADEDLKPYVDMAMAGADSLLGKDILHYGEETPRPIAQAVLLLLGALWGAKEVASAVSKAMGLLKPYKDVAA